MAERGARRRRLAGITLIEVMVAVTILAKATRSRGLLKWVNRNQTCCDHLR